MTSEQAFREGYRAALAAVDIARDTEDLAWDVSQTHRDGDQEQTEAVVLDAETQAELWRFTKNDYIAVRDYPRLARLVSMLGGRFMAMDSGR